VFAYRTFIAMSKTLKIPSYVRANITANSYNEADRTIEVVFATEVEAKRVMWDGTKYTEKLICTPESVRLERANSGANLVDTHSTYSVNTIYGVVSRAWVENGECKATVRLSKRQEVAGIVGDIIDGIITNISVGYRIYETSVTENEDTNTYAVRVEDWEPGELSVCSVPVDYAAGVRSVEDPKQAALKFHEITFTQNTRTMTPEEIAAAALLAEQKRTATPPVAPDPAVTTEQGIQLERTRVSAITLAVRSANISDQTFLDGLLSAGSTIDEARAQILERLIAAQTPPAINARVGNITNEEGQQVRTALEEVLMHRHDPTHELRSDKAKEMRHATLLDMASMSLRSKGIILATGSISRDELVKRAMSTSDYPILLGNTINRSLRAAYETATPEWRKFARKQSASDFKAMSSVGIGGDFKLLKIQEGGEYKQAKMVETGDNFKLDTYGRTISITRHAIINDDLGGFMRYTELFGRGAAELQAELVFGLLTANNGLGRKLSDGKNLFDAAHNNLAAAGAVLSIESLTAARLAMRRQKGMTNEKIIVRPKYLVVPPELETLAWQLVSAAITPGTTAVANPFYQAFEVIVDVYLENPTSWYITADPSSIPVVQYAFLNGQEGLYTEQELNFKTDDLDIKVRTDFAATIEEHRGVYKNPGQ
jgi:hypothetical protein